MALIDRLAADLVCLRGALRTLKMTTPIAKNPTRIFPTVIDELADKFGDAPALLSDRERLTYRELAETPEEPLVIHGVQHIMHPPARLECWPDADERTRIVLITRDLEPEAVTRLFDAFLNRSTIDRPDRAALLDNPLVPFGGVDR